MKHFYTWCLMVFALTVSSPKANAFSYEMQPLNTSVIQADAIIEARTTRVPQQYSLKSNDKAEVEIKRVFKGALNSRILEIQLQPFHTSALGRLQLGKDYIFFLQSVGTEAPKFEAPKFEVMFSGTGSYTDEQAKLIASSVELSPAWSRSQNGLSIVLTTETFRPKADEELNFYVGFKNTTHQRITLKYHDWPLDTHTYVTLDIKTEKGDYVLALPHPTLTQEDINNYFSKSPHSYEIALAPQQSWFFKLRTVNSAKPGWGYKEQLNFKYYPVTKPGKYTITAKIHNFLDNSVLIAGGLTISLN